MKCPIPIPLTVIALFWLNVPKGISRIKRNNFFTKEKFYSFGRCKNMVETISSFFSTNTKTSPVYS